MSCRFLPLLFLIVGIHLFVAHSLAFPDEHEAFPKDSPIGTARTSRKHAAPKSPKGEMQLPRNKTPAPPLRENAPAKDHKHPVHGDRSPKVAPRPSLEHAPKLLPRKTEPSPKHKPHAPAQKPTKSDKLPQKGAPAIPRPVGEAQNRSKHPLPKEGMKGCKKPSSVRPPASGKKTQCHLRSL